MSNSTAVAATIGVSALGVLAYYGYQNLGGKTDDVQVGELYNDIDNTATDGEEKDLQTQAKEEVAKAVKTGMNAWSGFWQNEYDDINGAHDEASAADVVTQKDIQIEKEE